MNVIAGNNVYLATGSSNQKVEEGKKDYSTSVIPTNRHIEVLERENAQLRNQIKDKETIIKLLSK